MRKYLIIIFIAQQIFSQNLSVISEKKLFSEAVCMSVSQTGYIFASDRIKNEIYKLDSVFNILATYGGFGTGTQNFDDPTDIYTTSLNLAVTDRNNNRVQVFDRNLNYLYTFNPASADNQTSDISYPSGCVLSTAGDFFLLDGENNRVLKFDSRGKFLLQFGNYESGKFELHNPAKILTDGINYLFAFEKNRLVVFDLYGNGLTESQIKIDLLSASLSNNYMLLNSNSEVLIFETRNFNSPVIAFNLEKDFDINSISQAAILNNNLIVLSKEKLIKFRFEK